MGAPGETNTIQAIDSLTNTVWATVGSVVVDGSGLMESMVDPSNAVRFFRLVE